MTTKARPDSRNHRAKRPSSEREAAGDHVAADEAAMRDDPLLQAMVTAVLAGARQRGWLEDRSARIGGRISPELLRKARLRTGLTTDTDLIEFALATIALDDDFPEVFEKTRGTVDPDIKLGY